MKTYLAQNEFIPNSTANSPRAVGSAVANPCVERSATAEQVSDDACRPSLPLGESEPLVTLACVLSDPAAIDSCQEPMAAEQSQAKATKGKAGTAGVTGPVRRSTAGTGLRVGEASADLPATSEFMDVTARRDEHLTSDIPEIFHWVRKLMKDAPAFVLDEAAFMAAIDEEPLFLREDGYLQRREA